MLFPISISYGRKEERQNVTNTGKVAKKTEESRSQHTTKDTRSQHTVKSQEVEQEDHAEGSQLQPNHFQFTVPDIPTNEMSPVIESSVIGSESTVEVKPEVVVDDEHDSDKTDGYLITATDASENSRKDTQQSTDTDASEMLMEDAVAEEESGDSVGNEDPKVMDENSDSPEERNYRTSNRLRTPKPLFTYDKLGNPTVKMFLMSGQGQVDTLGGQSVHDFPFRHDNRGNSHGEYQPAQWQTTYEEQVGIARHHNQESYPDPFCNIQNDCWQTSNEEATNNSEYYHQHTAKNDTVCPVYMKSINGTMYYNQPAVENNMWYPKYGGYQENWDSTQHTILGYETSVENHPRTYTRTSGNSQFGRGECHK